MSSKDTAELGSRAQRFSPWLLAPVLIFLGVAALFGYALTSGDPSTLPSALIGRPAPAVAFAPLDGLADGSKPVPGFAAADLANGQVSVVNFWASWCAPCIQEHPLLGELKQRTGVAIYGVNHKDDPSAARRFLGRYGNPYVAVGVDPSGRGAIDWGVYGMPETFVIDGRGRIVFKHVGPISASSLEAQLVPSIKKAQSGTN